MYPKLIFTMSQGSKHISNPLLCDIDKTAGDEATTDNDYSSSVVESKSNSPTPEEITESTVDSSKSNSTSLRQEQEPLISHVPNNTEDSLLQITSGPSILSILFHDDVRSNSIPRNLTPEEISTLDQQQQQNHAQPQTPSISPSFDTTIISEELEKNQSNYGDSSTVNPRKSESATTFDTAIEGEDSGSIFQIEVEDADESQHDSPPPILYAIEFEESDRKTDELLFQDALELDSEDYAEELLAEDLEVELVEHELLRPEYRQKLLSLPESSSSREKSSQTPTKPQRRKTATDNQKTDAVATTAILRKKLEQELRHYDPKIDKDIGNRLNYGTIGKEGSDTMLPIFLSPREGITVYRARTQSVGRRLSSKLSGDDLLVERDRHRGRYASEAEAYRKLSTTTRTLIVDEDTRIEDLVQIHVRALEQRVNRNNYSALDILESETPVTTPVGYEYSDRVLRRKHQIAWELALISPMMKKGIVETSIPVAATHFYTRKISFWHRLCSRFKLCFTCVWQTPSTDLEVDSGLLTTDSIEAFQQELNVMEYLGAQHQRTSERRQDILESSNSMKKLMSNIGSGSPERKRR